MQQNVFRLFLALVLLLSAGTLASAQGTKKGESDAAWFAGKSWLKGLKLTPHKSINQRVFTEQYHKNQAAWDKAFAFMRDHDLATMAPGKYPIDGEQVFATITEAPGKDKDKTQFESHRNYSDLQYVISGKEMIGVCPVSKAKVTRPYNPAGDGANYTAKGKYYLAEPGTFFIFSPEEAHRPGIKGDNSGTPIKKLVIKVRMAGR
ncbi:YhcH/YjgK/YiaL family protein [Compostibacter hankyongensis]